MGSKKYGIIGIDEAGRGPLAGPVAVSAFLLGDVRKKEKKEFVYEIFGEKGLRDSKKMSELEREEAYKKILFYKKRGTIDFVVLFGSEVRIDKDGISKVIKVLVEKCLSKLKASKSDKVLLDGSLYAPKRFVMQKTIIKGDEKEHPIALASICAKVMRDKYMKRLAKKYPRYELEIHKGYGTKKHRELIKKFGISKIHRRTYCGNIDGV